MTSRPIYPPYPVTTVSGREVYPHAPDPSQIVIEDIAHALSLLCRYAGHTKEFYSVAQHSVLVSDLLALNRDTAGRYALPGLLHDAAEAYLIDLPQPVKSLPGLNGAYSDYEAKMDRAVRRALLPHLWAPSGDELDFVKGADGVVARAEMRDLFPAGAFAARHTESDFPTIVPLPPVAARELFLATYHRLRSTP
jgi:5'-deoxynucleotidase YfbR-like HD superfamily hydrolase